MQRAKHNCILQSHVKTIYQTKALKNYKVKKSTKDVSPYKKKTENTLLQCFVPHIKMTDALLGGINVAEYPKTTF